MIEYCPDCEGNANHERTLCQCSCHEDGAGDKPGLVSPREVHERAMELWVNEGAPGDELPEGRHYRRALAELEGKAFAERVAEIERKAIVVMENPDDGWGRYMALRAALRKEATREFAERVREKERACPYKHDHLRGCAVTDHLDEMLSAELEGKGVKA